MTDPNDPVIKELKALRKYIDTGFAVLWLALTILLLAIVASCVMNG